VKHCLRATVKLLRMYKVLASGVTSYEVCAAIKSAQVGAEG